LGDLLSYPAEPLMWFLSRSSVVSVWSLYQILTVPYLRQVTNAKMKAIIMPDDGSKKSIIYLICMRISLLFWPDGSQCRNCWL